MPDPAGYWRPGGSSPCRTCGRPADTIYLDLGFQHPACHRDTGEVPAVTLIPRDARVREDR